LTQATGLITFTNIVWTVNYFVVGAGGNGQNSGGGGNGSSSSPDSGGSVGSGIVIIYFNV